MPYELTLWMSSCHFFLSRKIESWSWENRRGLWNLSINREVPRLADYRLRMCVCLSRTLTRWLSVLRRTCPQKEYKYEYNRTGRVKLAALLLLIFLFFSELSSIAWARLENGRIFVERHCTCAHLKAVLLDGVECVFELFRRASQWADRIWPGRLQFDMASSVSFFFLSFFFFFVKGTHLRKDTDSKSKKTKARRRKFCLVLAATVTKWFTCILSWLPEATQP